MVYLKPTDAPNPLKQFHLLLVEKNIDFWAPGFETHPQSPAVKMLLMECCCWMLVMLLLARSEQLTFCELGCFKKYKILYRRSGLSPGQSCFVYCISKCVCVCCWYFPRWWFRFLKLSPLFIFKTGGSTSNQFLRIHIEDLNLPKLPQPFEALRAFLDRGPWIKSRSLDALDEELEPGEQIR